MKRFFIYLSGALLPVVLAQAQTLTTLVNFNGTNGANPVGLAIGLVQGANGSFYGTTYSGGTSNNGSIFNVTSDGTLTTLVNFNGTNGAFPYVGLTQDTNGNFYGTTAGGGTNNLGTIFRMTSDGLLTTLVSFKGTNGALPEAAPVQGSDGNFYGTTAYGGNLTLGGNQGVGTVYKVTFDGTLTTLVIFNGTNGAIPRALMLGNDGSFYGTTYEGGTNSYGTVFRMTPNGTLTTLASFNGTNGSGPAGLIQGRDGNFYGTTQFGGTNNNGTVFKMAPDGTLNTQVIFNGTNGSDPLATLIEGSDGNFYGTTQFGGTIAYGVTNNNGIIFRMTPDGTLTTLFQFNGTNGIEPVAPVTQGSDGNLYGTCFHGGLKGDGTVFKITGLSLLPAFQSIALASGNVQMVWNSVSNWTYRVQFKTNLTDALWNNLPGDVLAGGGTAGKTDPVIPAQRFYRVVLLP